MKKAARFSVVVYAEHDHHLPKPSEVEAGVRAALSSAPGISALVSNIPKHSAAEAMMALAEIRRIARDRENFCELELDRIIESVDKVLGPEL